MTTTKVKVDGIAVYASVHTPNKVTGVFGLDLVVDQETEKELIAIGMSPAKNRLGELVQHEGFPGKVFRFKRKVQAKNGDRLSPPTVVDSQGTNMTNLVGNGSKVRVYGNAYSYKTPTGVSGVAGGLNILQVINLVEYGSGVDKIEGGFVASSGPNMTTDIDVSDDDVKDII